MYRHSPWCDHRFRGSKPRLTPRSAVGFFGFGGSAGSPLGTDHPAYFGVATIMFARPFLPSTCVILQQHWKLSTRSEERRVGSDWSSDVCSSDLVAPWNRSPSLLRSGYYYVCQTFSAVDMCDPTAALEIVNAQGWCKCGLFLCANLFAQAIEIRCVLDRLCHYPRPIHIFFTEL